MSIELDWQIVEDEPQEPEATPPPPVQRRWPRIPRKLLAVMALILLVVTAGLAIYYDRVYHAQLDVVKPPVLQVAHFEARAVAKGDFRDADQIHKGSGTATLVETEGGVSILRFSDFKVTNGPDLKVWMVKAGNIESAADVTDSEWLTLGPLKGNIGDQNYVLPEGTDVAAFKSVVIWCEQFGVLFASAMLKAEAAGP